MCSVLRQQHGDEENKETIVTCTRSGEAKAPYFHIEVVAELLTHASITAPTI